MARTKKSDNNNKVGLLTKRQHLMLKFILDTPELNQDLLCTSEERTNICAVAINTNFMIANSHKKILLPNRGVVLGNIFTKDIQFGFNKSINRLFFCAEKGVLAKLGISSKNVAFANQMFFNNAFYVVVGLKKLETLHFSLPNIKIAFEVHNEHVQEAIKKCHTIVFCEIIKKNTGQFAKGDTIAEIKLTQPQVFKNKRELINSSKPSTRRKLKF